MVNQSPFKEEVPLIANDLSEELKTYLSNKFKSNKTIPSFENETGIEYWEDLAKKITEDKLLFNELKKCYPQLNFPIELGIEEKQEYKDVVLKGKTKKYKIAFCIKIKRF